MADRNQDHPSQKGVKGFLRRNFTAAPDGEGLWSIYKQEVKKEFTQVPAHEVPFAWTVQTLFFGMVACVPGVAVGLGAYVVLNEDAAKDAAIVAGLDNPYGYQAVRFNDNQTLMLVAQDGTYRVYNEHKGELVLQGSSAAALEAAHRVSQSLSDAITALENGAAPSGDVPEFIRYTGLSEAYADYDGDVERRFDAAASDPSADSNILAAMRAALPQWQAAAQAIATSPHGYTAEQKSAMHQERSGEDYVFGTMALVGLLGAVIGFTGPFTAPVGRSIRRRREFKNNASPS